MPAEVTMETNDPQREQPEETGPPDRAADDPIKFDEDDQEMAAWREAGRRSYEKWAKENPY